MARVPPPQVQHWEPPDTGTADVRLLTGNRFSCPIPKTKTCSKISQLFSCPVEGLARYDSGAAAYSCGYRASISPLVTLAGSVVLLGIAVGLSQLAGQLSVVLCWRWALHGDDALSRVARSIASLGGLVCMIASVSVAVLAPIYSAATSDFDCQFEDMPSLALASSGADACYPYWVGTAVALAGVVAWRRTRKGAAPIDGAADPQAPSGDGEAKEASLSAPVPAASAAHKGWVCAWAWGHVCGHVVMRSVKDCIRTLIRWLVVLGFYFACVLICVCVCICVRVCLYAYVCVYMRTSAC